MPPPVKGGPATDEGAGYSEGTLRRKAVGRLGRIVENNPQRQAPARPDGRNPVPHLRPVDPPGARHRALVHREGDGVALVERNDMGARLHPRALFGQHEFPALKVPAGL